MSTPRLTAASSGQKTYSTGKACRRGHFDARYTSTGCCVTCVRLHASNNNAALRKARSLLNTERFEPARIYKALVRPSHHSMFDELAAITAYATPDTIAQCAAFISMMHNQVKGGAS